MLMTYTKLTDRKLRTYQVKATDWESANRGKPAIWYKANGLFRYVLAHTATGILPLYIVNEYPKSGGTWVGQMLSTAMSLPFPRNCMPKFEPSIMHGHFIRPYGMKNVLCVWRDGRDVMVSWYYHCLFKNEHHNSRLVEIVRKDLQFDDWDDIRTNLPQFIEYVFRRQKYPNFSWADFVRIWRARSGVVHVRYEDMRVKTADELQRIVFELSGARIGGDNARDIAEKFSFARMSGRSQGEERKNSFMRKGIVGDWENHFSHEARRLFDEYAGNELISMGYEENHDWATRG